MTLTQLTFVFNPTICLGYLNLQYWHQFLLSQRCYLYKIHFSSWLFKLGYLYLLLFIIIFKFTYGLYKLICKRVTRILFIKWLPSQLTYSCSKSTIETLEKSMKYVQNEQYKHQNDVIDVATLFWCFYC